MSSVSYTYDSVGNVLTKTDARSITATNTYDPINRLTQTSYSDGSTPAVTYTYDGSTNGVGYPTSISNGLSTTGFAGYDALGHVTQSTQTTAGNNYSFAYVYNLAGDLVSERFPSGRTTTTGYDVANRITSVAAGQTSYVSNIQYAPSGLPNSYVFGNGLQRAFSYDTRLQPQELVDTDTVHGQGDPGQSP